ncbi:DUF6456 domain-containing protein [Novosphingobium sp. KCTC 2891]|uniref:DUF6456 domain-containing protein n=1 Tax=Novosphingobium sp. KCTC 2891 TaxID=2989730 RepID=UPI002221AA67|nr:DUF6456 domain-containing protein [Novosphingobium sp. KCTC 2891]MCW1384107.1 DUF6456 domain-containing protein [Novosphingobium sp. KCTC 2891]
MSQVLEDRELTTEGPLQCSMMKGKSRTVKVNIAESPLTWLHARGHLDDRRFAAGERLRADWECAQLAPVVTMQWNPVRLPRDPGRDLTAGERQLAARRRFDSAISAAGNGLSDILWRVVCAGEGLPVVERALGWPVRSGKLVLGIALDRVADYYRIR